MTRRGRAQDLSQRLALPKKSMVVAMEAALAQEANTPRGYNISVPDPKQAGQLTTDLRGSKGGLSLVPSVASDAAWGQGMESKPSDDWMSKRIGMMPPLPMVELRSRAELSVLAAAGVPTTIMSTSDGTAKKEGFRRFLHLTLAPVGRIVAQLSRAERKRTSGVSTLSDYVRLSVKGKCPLSRLPC